MAKFVSTSGVSYVKTLGLLFQEYRETDMNLWPITVRESYYKWCCKTEHCLRKHVFTVDMLK